MTTAANARRGALRGFLRAHREPLLAALVSAMCAAAVFGSGGRDLLLGGDSYTIAATSRVERAADLRSLVTEELMRGAFPYGRMYRPTLGLSVALDVALFGTFVPGYLLTNALLYALSGLALFGLARRLDPHARFAPWVALAVYLAHPVHAVVVPILARRPELLVTALGCASLIVSLGRTARWRPLTLIGSGVLAGLAVGAKPSAAILVPIAFAVHLLAGRRPGCVRAALRACLPHLIGVLALLAARVAVLGGVGGYHEPYPTALLDVLRLTARSVIVPGIAPAGQGAALPALGYAGVIAAAFGIHRLRAGPAVARPAVFAALPAVGLVWLLLGIIVAQAGGGRSFGWYAVMPLVGWALLLASASEALITGSSRGRGWRAAAAAVAMAGLVVVGAWVALGSPVLGASGTTREHAREVSAYLAATRARILASAPGSVVHAPPLPLQAATLADSDPKLLLKPMTLQGWADLTLRSHPVQVELQGHAVERRSDHRPPPGERRLVVDLAAPEQR